MSLNINKVHAAIKSLLLNHNKGHEKSTRPKTETYPKTKFLGRAMCNPTICATTRAGSDPRTSGGGLRPASFPHPMFPTVRQVILVLQATKHAWIQAMTCDSEKAHDGLFQWRYHSARAVRLHIPSKRASVSNVQLPLTTSKHELHAANHEKESAVYKIRYDRSLRIEGKRQGAFDSFHFGLDDTQYGQLKISLTPKKKFFASAVFRNPAVPTANLLNSKSLIAAKGYSSSNTSTHSSFSRSDPHVDTEDRMSVSTHGKALKGNQSSASRFKELSSKATMRSGASKRVATDKTQVNSHSARSSPLHWNLFRFWKGLKAKSKYDRLPQIGRRPLMESIKALRLEAEYGRKQKRWTIRSNVKVCQGEFAVRSMSNPWHVQPRLKIPIGKFGGTNPWFDWSPGKKSLAGEMIFGWKKMSLAVGSHDGSVKIARKDANGSGFAVLVDKKKMAKVDGFIVTKRMKGKIAVVLNGSVGNRKDCTGANVSLNSANASLSLYGVASSSFGLTFDNNFHLKNKSYRIGLTLDDFQNVGVRLGIFY